MGLMAAAPDVLAAVLSKTDEEALVAVMQTSSAACRLVRSLRDRIRLEHPLAGFVSGLPVVTSRYPCEEQNVALWGSPGPLTTCSHAVRGHGYLTLPAENVEYMSIRVPAAARFIALVTGGMHVLHLDSTLLRLFADGDGTVEVMRFMRHLGWMYWHNIQIYYDTAATPMAVHTATAHSVRQALPTVPVSWRVVQVRPVASHTCEPAAPGCCLRLDSNYTSFGHVVVAEDATGPLADAVALFTLVLDDTRHKLDGSAASSRDARGRCPVPLGPGCYYLPMAGKVNCSCVRRLQLHVAFRRPVAAAVRVYNVHANYFKDLCGMCGVVYGD